MPFQVGAEIAAGLKIGTERVGGVKIGTDVVFRTLPFGNLGRLPFQEGVHQFVPGGLGVASNDGHLYAWNLETNAQFGGLWRINPRNPSDTSGDFGRVGTIAGRDMAQMTTVDNTTNHPTAGVLRILGLLLYDTDSRSFYHMRDPSTLSVVRYGGPDRTLSWLANTAVNTYYFAESSGSRNREDIFRWDTTRGFRTNPQATSRFAPPEYVAAEWYDGDMLVVDQEARSPTSQDTYLTRMDLNDPVSTTPPYGRIGLLPANVDVTDMALHEGNLLVTNSHDNTLWHIDPTNPGRTS